MFFVSTRDSRCTKFGTNISSADQERLCKSVKLSECKESRTKSKDSSLVVPKTDIRDAHLPKL